MEADLHRYHHLDLVDLYRGRLSLRKVHVLVTHLPYDGALARALSDGRPVFGLTDYLIADVWVALMRANFKDPPDRHPWLETPSNGTSETKRSRMLDRQRRYATRRSEGTESV